MVANAGATPVLIAPRLLGIASVSDGLDAQGQLAGTPSVNCDAVALVLIPEAAAQLCNNPSAVQFVSDAYAHLKAIGHSPGAQPLLDRAGVAPGEGITDLGEDFLEAASVRHYQREALPTA
jgi:catalase